MKKKIRTKKTRATRGKSRVSMMDFESFKEELFVALTKRDSANSELNDRWEDIRKMEEWIENIKNMCKTFGRKDGEPYSEFIFRNLCQARNDKSTQQIIASPSTNIP